MRKQQIEFIIRPDGTVEERPAGFEGESCEEVTRPIEQRLGRVEHREATAERYLEPLADEQGQAAGDDQ